MGTRYNRALNPAVEAILSEGGKLQFLISDRPGLSADPFALDIQIREGNTLMYYHGTTRLLTLTFPEKAKGFPMAVKARAAPAYKEYPVCGEQYETLMKDWLLSDISAFKEAWQAYLISALKGAEPKYYGDSDNRSEGYWQNRLCIKFGPCWKPDHEWLIVDRECVIGFHNTTDKDAHYEKAQTHAIKIKRELQASDEKKWGQPDEKGFGDELDMLAIDKRGQLIVIELKHGSYARGIYWGPLQAGVYYRAFKDAPAEVIDGVRRLANQKINLGLLPKDAQPRVTEASLRLGDPVLAIADPNEKSACWGQLAEVLAKIRDGGNGTPVRIVEIGETVDNIEVKDCTLPEKARAKQAADQLLAKEFIRIKRLPDKTEFSVQEIHWDGQTPRPEWKCVESAPSGLTEQQEGKIISSILRMKKYFKRCKECGNLTPNGWMHDNTICQSCAERNHGVAH